MRENGVIVFPAFLNTQQKVFDGIRILQLIKPGPINEFIIKGLCRHVVFNFILFLNNVGFGEAVGELDPFIDLVEVVVIKTVDVEGLGFEGLLMFDGLLQLGEEIFHQFIGVGGQFIADEFLLQVGGRLFNEEGNVDVFLLLEQGHQLQIL